MEIRLQGQDRIRITRNDDPFLYGDIKNNTETLGVDIAFDRRNKMIIMEKEGLIKVFLIPKSHTEPVDLEWWADGNIIYDSTSK